MNTPLHFQIDDKTIYNMGFNPGATQNYVPETSTTALTSQILEFLNPQNGNDDKVRMFTDLMAPIYQKQNEILEKIEKLSNIMVNFIEHQKPINDIVLKNNEKPIDNFQLRRRRSSCEIVEEAATSKQQSIFLLSDEPSTSSAALINDTSPEEMPAEKLTVRDFLKTTINVVKQDNEIETDEEGNEIDETTKKYNKFRVRNKAKKYKSSGVTYTQVVGQQPQQQSTTIQQQEEEERTDTPPSFQTLHPIVQIPYPQRATESVEFAIMQQQNLYASIMNQQVYPFHSQSQSSFHSVHSEPKIPSDDTCNLWKTMDNVTQLLADAPTVAETEIPTKNYNGFHVPHLRNSFVPLRDSNEEQSGSAFQPTGHYHKERHPNIDGI